MGIQKIEVARGIQWIEVPEAGRRVLCGCPAGAVKHLIKRGLIQSKEVKGVTFDIGPNAILLAGVLDTPVDCTQYHFGAEEKLMALYHDPGADAHRSKHGDLILHVAEYRKRVLAGYVPDKAGFLHFFETWLVRHILDEDRKYGAFLNAQGVY